MRLVLILLTFICLSSALRAQEGYEHFSVAAHGAGRTYVVTSRGLDAIGLNPALLTIAGGKRFELRAFPVTTFGLDAGESFRDANVLADVFNLKSIDSLDRSRIVDLLRDEKLSGRGDAAVLGVAYDAGSLGAFAITWTSHAAMRTDIPQDFLDFFSLAESKLAQRPGSVSGLDLQALWHNEFSASYARSLFRSGDTSEFLQSVRAGVSLKYVAGIGLLKLEDGNYFSWKFPDESPQGGGSKITANYRVLSSHTSDFDPKKAPNKFSVDFLAASEAGSGLGADVGIIIGLLGSSNGRPILQVGTSLCGLGSITWRTNALERTADNISKTFMYSGTFQGLTDSLRAFEGIKTRVPEFSQPLPTMFRFGAQLDLDALEAKIFGFAPQLGFEIAQGLTDMVGSLPKPRFGVGMSMQREGSPLDYRLSGGFAVDYRSADITLGGGITIFNYVAFDIATAHLLELFSSKPRIDIAASLKVLL
jgi:hypothetical protein